MLSEMEGKPLLIGQVGGKTLFAARSRTIDRMVVWNVVHGCSVLVVSAPVTLASLSLVVSDSAGSARFAVVASQGGNVGAVASAGTVPVVMAGGGGLLTLWSGSSGGGDVMVGMGVRRYTFTL